MCAVSTDAGGGRIKISQRSSLLPDVCVLSAVGYATARAEEAQSAAACSRGGLQALAYVLAPLVWIRRMAKAKPRSRGAKPSRKREGVVQISRPAVAYHQNLR